MNRIPACVVFFLSIALLCGPLYAEEGAAKETKGLDIVSDVAISIIKKTNAFFQGNLDITMEQDADKYKKKNKYSRNAIGQKIPASTNPNFY